MRVTRFLTTLLVVLAATQAPATAHPARLAAAPGPPRSCTSIAPPGPVVTAPPTRHSNVSLMPSRLPGRWRRPVAS